MFVESGRSDYGRADDGRRVAAFASEITLAPGAETKIAIVIGQAENREAALRWAREADVGKAEARLAATREHWAKRLGFISIETNRPDFDRLVNTWLPYQF